MKYELTTLVQGGMSPSKMSPSKFMQYKAEQKEIRDAINAVAVAHGRGKVFNSDLDDFSKYHVFSHIGYTAIGDGETGKTKFTIVKREKPIDVVEFDNSGNRIVAAHMTMTHAERINLSKCRGKYNDGELLSLSDSASIELGEVQPNGGGFYS